MVQIFVSGRISGAIKEVRYLKKVAAGAARANFGLAVPHLCSQCTLVNVPDKHGEPASPAPFKHHYLLVATSVHLITCANAPVAGARVYGCNACKRRATREYVVLFLGSSLLFFCNGSTVRVDFEEFWLDTRNRRSGLEYRIASDLR